MNAEEKQDLHEMSVQLAYEAILFSHLNGNLSNSQWDELAEQLAVKLDSYLDGLITEEFIKIEIAAEIAEEEKEREAA